MAPLNALVKKDLLNNGDLGFANEISSSGFTIAYVVGLASVCGLIILIAVCGCCGGGRSKDQKKTGPETVAEGEKSVKKSASTPESGESAPLSSNPTIDTEHKTLAWTTRPKADLPMKSITVDPGVMPTILKATPGAAGAPASVAEDHIYFEVSEKHGVSKKPALKEGGYRVVCPLGAAGSEKRKAVEQPKKAGAYLTMCPEVAEPVPVAKKEGGYRSMAPLTPIQPKLASPVGTLAPPAPYGYPEGKTQVRES